MTLPLNQDKGLGTDGRLPLRFGLQGDVSLNPCRENHEVVLMKLENKTAAYLYQTVAQIGRLKINTTKILQWKIPRFQFVKVQ